MAMAMATSLSSYAVPQILCHGGRRNLIRAGGYESEQERPTKLVTFLGKGGSGKTTAAVLASQYYANEGLRTCLVMHSQDSTAEQLLGCKIGPSPSLCTQNLSVVRLETTKMLLEPLARLKKADAQVNLTQGILEGVVGEELGILPGMDSIFSALALEKWINFLGTRNNSQKDFDVVVYDGTNTEETLRVIGAAERARQYMKYIRNVADKTDIGRLVSPSILKLAYESASLNGRLGDGKSSTEIWSNLESILEKVSSSFMDSSRFRCYLVMDLNRPASVRTALRYWGCAVQAGTEISGAFAFATQSTASLVEAAQEKMLPLAVTLLPYIPEDTPMDWDKSVRELSQEAQDVLSASSSSVQSVVQFDRSKKTVTLFMPGFDKSEIKLYQYRGGTELLVEAGDRETRDTLAFWSARKGWWCEVY